MGIWLQIPDESWVKVGVEAEPGDEDPGFTAEGLFHSSTGDDEPLEDLHLGPRRRKLRTPTNYTVRVTVNFAVQSTAHVVAEVTDPQGAAIVESLTKQAQFRSSPIKGKAGTARSVTLFLVSQQGEGSDLA
jgi:hypothetical protein